jgi:hypothetical protein
MIRKTLSSSCLSDCQSFKKVRTEHISGKCSCGAVGISIVTNKPLRSYFCHCQRCRKGKLFFFLKNLATGSCFTLIGSVYHKDANIIGEENLMVYNSIKTKRYSCSNCGAWIYFLDENMERLNFFI